MDNPAKQPAMTRIPTLKTVEKFRELLSSLNVELPCDDAIKPGADSPLVQPLTQWQINGKTVGNRVAIQPMEGWDGTTTGGVTDDMRRRWQRFGESGAKLIYGGEAMAVRADGRANPNQLILVEENREEIAGLVRLLKESHQEHHGDTDNLVIGFQLTHSGRFCKPNDKFKMEPRVAFRHPILDRKFNVTSDDQVWTDDELDELIQCYIRAARVAQEAGADFVDVKHCHGYLLHEFLGARTRAGRFGGGFENRTRILREVVAGIRQDGNPIDIGVRLSAFDFVPFKPDPTRAREGRLGPGIPEDFTDCLPYRYGFGVNPDNPVESDLSETFQFAELCANLGVKLLNLSAGSPYYNPHIQRPAAYPPSDGYQPPEDPLVGVARQMNVVRRVREHLAGLRRRSPEQPVPALIGSAYSYLQEFLPHVAQAAIRDGWTDFIGLGRVTLSYPTILGDAGTDGKLKPRFICRTFSDCTTGPRNGLISGCYPLDDYYKVKPEAATLKKIKQAKGV